MPNQILALIPAYNEEKAIKMVVSQSLKYLPVLVVDDGSSDATVDFAKEAGAIVICNDKNLGKGAAMINGFKYALENDYQAVMVLDADGQHDPEEIPLFLESYQEHQGNLTIGMRDFSKMPPIRRLANSLGTFLVNRLSNQYIPDDQSGYRLIDHHVMKLLLDSTEMGFEFEVEMIFACLHAGLAIQWVPIKTIYADENSHISPLSHVREYFRILNVVSKKYRLN